MDLNYVLFLVATLNFTNDAVSSYRYKARLPRWIPIVTGACLLICGVSWFLFPDIAGFIAATVLALYIISMKVVTRRNLPTPKFSKSGTYLLIALNLAAFVVQYVNSATSRLDRLVDLGALYAPLLEQGEWWRLLAAQFLHFGFLHVACNMLGLSFLGPVVERAIGPIKMIFVYLICGAIGMLITVTLYSWAGGDHPVVLLGASASVLGLVGFSAAQALMKYRVSRNAVDKMQLGAMGQIIAMQFVFDLFVPEVSSTAHLAGAGVGFVIGLLSGGVRLPDKSYHPPRSINDEYN